MNLFDSHSVSELKSLVSLLICFHASAVTVARGIMFSGCHSLSVQPSVPFSWTQYLRNALRNFFKFDTDIHLDSRMNWLDFGGQRSRSLWPRITHFWLSSSIITCSLMTRSSFCVSCVPSTLAWLVSITAAVEVVGFWSVKLLKEGGTLEIMTFFAGLAIGKTFVLLFHTTIPHSITRSTVSFKSKNMSTVLYSWRCHR